MKTRISTRFSKIITAVAVLTLVALLSFMVCLKTIVPTSIQSQLIEAVEIACPSCHLAIQQVRISIFPAHLTLVQVHLRSVKPKDIVIDAQAEEINVVLSLKPLLSHLLDIDNLVFNKPKVTVTEFDFVNKNLHKDEATAESLWRFRIARTMISDGNFIYRRESAGKIASLQVRQINGGIDEMGSTPLLRETLARGHVAAVFENSGRVDLTVSPRLFSKALHVNVELELDDMKLDAVNAFFDSCYGVRLSGLLRQGRTSILVRGDNLHGSVFAKYEKFSVSFKKTKERGEIATFFSNLSSSLKINREDLDKNRRDQIRAVELSRNPAESLVTFIFRGMKEAALKVATD